MKQEILQLEFGRKNQLKFSSEEEFFEMLGLLCRKDSLTTITGDKTDAMTIYKEDGTLLRLRDISEGVQLDEYLSKGAFAHPGLHSYEVVCSRHEIYPKAFADLVDASKDGRVSCAEYVRYLIDHFGAYLHCAKHDGYKLTVKLPEGEQMKEVLKDLGYGSFMASFEKGLTD